MTDGHYTADEMMTVVASRYLKEGQVCFVGIGLPSVAANLARLTHAPNLVLIYESGPIDTKPDVLPLSIGDGELAKTATTVVPACRRMTCLFLASEEKPSMEFYR
jgi:glutaconate CoA-transferase subunit B